MPGRIAIEPGVMRRQPLLAETVTSSTLTNHRFDAKSDGINGRGNHRGSRIGETTGECAAVCCCCPCALMHILILAVYRVPTGLCKKAWRKKKKRQRLLHGMRKNSSEKKETVNFIQWKTNSFGLYTDAYCDDKEDSQSTVYGCENDVVEWDKEMWDSFYGAGFWRSASQRDDHDR